MSEPFDFSEQVHDFSGRAPLFPLPNLVLFPHILQPLHIFEPRYREMVADALDGERLLAMALLKPGWETDRSAAPAIYSTVCLGRISAAERLSSGKYNLMLQGLHRASILEEERLDRPYRVGQLKIEDDIYEPIPAEIETEQRAALLAAFRGLLSQATATTDLSRIFNADLPTGILCDILAYAVKMEPIVAQQLLSELAIHRRCELLLQTLRETMPAKRTAEATRTFPPKFSLN